MITKLKMVNKKKFKKHLFKTPRVTVKRTLVKTLIYRIWVLLSTYVVLLLTGQTAQEALIPTLILNVLWSISYYNYDRIWQRIKWGIK